MKKVANFTGEEAGGVPFIVIGEKVFGGYIDSWNDQIKEAIDTAYKNGNDYDVFEEMAAQIRKEKFEKIVLSGLLPALSVLVSIGFGVAIILLQKKNTDKILKELSKVNTKSVAQVKEEKEVVKPVKKGRK
jgi:hypothetical protein